MQIYFLSVLRFISIKLADKERERERGQETAHSVKHEAVSYTHWLPSCSPETKPSLKPLREPTTSIVIKQTLIWEFNWFYFLRCCVTTWAATVRRSTLGSRALLTRSQQKAHNVFSFFCHLSALKTLWYQRLLIKLGSVSLTSTLDLSTFSLISAMQVCWRFCTVKLLVHPAISNRKVRSISMPLSVKSTSGWNCVPYSFFCSLAIPGGGGLGLLTLTFIPSD